MAGKPFGQHEQESSSSSAASPQSCHPSENNSQLQGAKENWSPGIQSHLLSGHMAQPRGACRCRGRSHLPDTPIPAASTPTCSRAEGNGRLAEPQSPLTLMPRSKIQGLSPSPTAGPSSRGQQRLWWKSTAGRKSTLFFPEIPSPSLHCCVYRQALQQQLEPHHFPQRWVLTGQ